MTDRRKNHRSRSGAAKQTEAEITRAIRGALKALGIFHWKQWQGPMSQPKGVSDIIGIFEGKPLAIEIKTGRGRLSEYQQAFAETWQREGGIFIEARSVDDVIEGLGIRDRFLL